MLNEIKAELIKNPDAIVEILEYFGFAHIKPSSREIRFARDECGGLNISIRLENNSYLNVSDYSRGVHADIFSYIIQEKNVTFRDVIQHAKKVLNLSNDWKPQHYQLLFDGFYNNKSRKNTEIKLKVHDDTILDQYEKCGNLRFFRDGIGIEAQRFWDIRFSVADNSIIIPIRNEYGELVGAKARINRDPEENESKYYYPISFPSGQVLYGYSDNYQYLYGADTVYIGESEKFCQQLYTMGIRNCVSMGSHTLSEKQAKLLLQLSPKSLTFMLDDGLDLSETKKNADMIKSVSSMKQIDMYFFDHTDCLSLGYKDSPSDHGIDVWNEIIENNIKHISELEN